MTRPTECDVLNLHFKVPASYHIATRSTSTEAGLCAHLFPEDESVCFSGLAVTASGSIWHPGMLEIRLAQAVRASTLILLQQGRLLRWLGPWSAEPGSDVHLVPLGVACTAPGPHRPALEAAAIYLTAPVEILIFQWATRPVPTPAPLITPIAQRTGAAAPKRALLVLPDLWGSSATLLPRMIAECADAGAARAFEAYGEIFGCDQADGAADPVAQAARLGAELARIRTAPNVPLDILAERRGTLVARALLDQAAVPTPGQLIAMGGARSGAMALCDMIDLRTTELVAQKMEALALLGRQLQGWLQADPGTPWLSPPSCPQQPRMPQAGSEHGQPHRLLARRFDVGLPSSRPDTVSAIADAVAPLFGDGDHELTAHSALAQDLDPDGAAPMDVARTLWSPFASSFPILGSAEAARRLASWLDPASGPASFAPSPSGAAAPPRAPIATPHAPHHRPLMPSGPSVAHPVAARPPTPSPAAPKVKTGKKKSVALAAHASMPSSPPVQEPVSIALSLFGTGVALPADGDPLQSIDVTARDRRLTLAVRAITNGRVLIPQAEVETPRPHEARTWLFPVLCEAPGEAKFAAEVWAGAERLFLGHLNVVAGGDSTMPAVAESQLPVIQEPQDGLVTLRVVETNTADGHTTLDFTLTGLDLNVEAPRRMDAGRYERFVTQSLEQLDATFAKVPSSATVDDRLRALGMRMADSLLPQPVRDALWTQRHKITAVQLVSEEQRLPWEVLFVDDPTSGEDGYFLATKGLTRWFRNVNFPVRSDPRPLNPAAVILPPYAREDLPAAVKETEQLRTELAEMTHWPGATGLLLARLKDRPRLGLLHFAGHGAPPIEKTDPGQIIGHMNGQKPSDIPESHLIAAHLKLRRQDAPLVFLNACYGGLSGRGLAQAEGYARAFIAPRGGGGASAFIGPSWRVNDEVGRQFAIAFYESLAAGQPLHAAATHARQVTQQAQNNLTWLAYAVYGDPLARYDCRAMAPR